MNTLKRIYDALTAARLTQEAGQQIHPADQVRSQLGQAGEHDLAQNPWKQIGQLGNAMIGAFMSSLEGAETSQPTANTGNEESSPKPSEDVVDITADNQHLANH